jgi:hypothetical protein
MYVFKLDSAQLLMEFIPVCYNYIVRLVLIPLLNHPHHVWICFQACPVSTLQRQEYDFEEDIRNAWKRSSKGSVHRSPEQNYGNRSFNPRQWQSSRVHHSVGTDIQMITGELIGSYIRSECEKRPLHPVASGSEQGLLAPRSVAPYSWWVLGTHADSPVSTGTCWIRRSFVLPVGYCTILVGRM